MLNYSQSLGMKNIDSAGNEYYRGNMPQLELFNLKQTQMKFTVQRNTLLAALSATGRAIGRSTVPIMECYRIAVSGNKASVTGSNYEVFLRQEIEVESQIELLNICIEASQLLDLIKKLPDQPMAFELFESKDKKVVAITVEITYTTGKCKMSAESGDNYPMFPEHGSVSYPVPANEFFDGVQRTLFAVDRTDNKAISNYLIRMGNGINLAGCSPEVVSHMVVSTATVNLADIVLSKPCAAALTGFPSAESIDISYSDKNMIIDNGHGFKASFIRMDTEFPKFEAMLNISDENHFTCDPRELESALKRVMIFTHKMSREIKISTSENEIIIETINESEETCKESVAAHVVGEISIGFNCDYALSAIQRIKSETCKFSFTQSHLPMLLTEVDSDRCEIKIMLAPCILNW